MVNCVSGSTCSGGYAHDVYKFAHDHGAVHATCQLYDAADHDCFYEQKGKAPDNQLNVCRTCSGTVPKTEESGEDQCTYNADSKKYYVHNYREFSGVLNMKREIYKNGPISCAVYATPEFDEYKGGYIYSQKLNFYSTNHIIAVVGWGEDEQGNEFWWGRNSWGTYWGEHGYFRMKMYEDNLWIESDCTSGIVSYDKPVDISTAQITQ